MAALRVDKLRSSDDGIKLPNVFPRISFGFPLPMLSCLSDRHPSPGDGCGGDVDADEDEAKEGLENGQLMFSCLFTK